MALSLNRWRPKHLLLSWLAYWLLLIVTVARPALFAALRAMSAPQGHGSMSANISNSGIDFSVKSDSMIWSGSTSLTSLALWIAGPPLVIWLFWLVTRTSPVAARERSI